MISVLVDTYNHQGYIRTAIDSVLAQTLFAGGGVAHEIIVVDDGSVDETPRVLAEYGDRIRVIRKANGGQASAFAEGLRHCTGDIVMFLDGDDWWHAEKAAKVAAAFADDPALVAVGHGIVVYNEQTGAEQFQRPPATLTLDLRNDAGITPFHSNMCFLGTSRLAARRAALEQIGPPHASLTYEADEHYFTLLPALGPVRVLDECLTWYRIHGANLYQSAAASALTEEGFAKAAKRAAIFRCLVETLTVDLARLGLPQPRIAAVLEPLDIAATRLELMTKGGSRQQVLAVEARNKAWLRQRGAASNPAMNAMMNVAAVALPPRQFYDLRRRYAQWRARTPDPTPSPKGNS